MKLSRDLFRIGRMKILLTLIISCFCVAVYASERTCYEKTETMTIPELLDRALQLNPQTAAAWSRAQRAAASVGSARSAYYPTVRFKAEGSHAYDYRFPEGHESTFSSVGGDFLLSYLLFDCGERKANSAAARAALDAACWQSDWTIQKVLYDVINKAYLLHNATELLAANEASLKDAVTALDAGKEHNRVGLRSVTDLDALQGAYIEAKMAVVQQSAEVRIARGQLAVSVGLAVDFPLVLVPLPEPMDDPIFERDLPMLLSLAQQRRGDLMAKRAELTQRNAELAKTKASYLPKVRFDGSTGYKHYVHDHSHGYRYNATLCVDVPIFNGFEPTYLRRMAYSDINTTSEELEKLELDIALEVLTHSTGVETASELLTLSRDNLESALNTYNGAIDRYKAGVLTIFDLTSAQRQLAAARIKQSEAKTRWYRSLAQLAYATGSIICEDTCHTMP